MKRYLLLLTVASAAFFGCTPEDKPTQDPAGFDVRLEIPAEIIIEQDAKTIEFNILDGKAPVQTDMIILNGPAGQKFCKIKTISGNVVSVELYAGVKEGQHKVSVQRSLDIKSLGTTNIKFKVYDDGVHPESGSSVYGRVSCEGQGLAGVVVSDGHEVAVTNKDGVYQLASKKKHGYVFVSVPSGYEAPIDIVFPQIHKYLSKSASVAERADFELKKVDNQDEFTLLTFGDMHLAGSHNDGNLQIPHFLEDVKDFKTATGGHVYGLTLGDMTWDKYWLSESYGFPEYKKEFMPLTGMTIYQTCGNHDHDINEKGDFDSMKAYKTHIGPSYYSYNIGKVHFVALDDIECANTGDGKNSEHRSVLVTEQIDWLKKDLAHVSKDTPIILSMHIELFNSPGLGTTLTYKLDVSNAAALEDILDDYEEVHIFTAHSHKISNRDETMTKNSIYEHNAGAVCAGWWTAGMYNHKANVATDGAPAGYTVVKVKGKDITWQYKGTKYPITHQFRSYDRNTMDFSTNLHISAAGPEAKADWEVRAQTWMGKSTANEVYINVWNYDSKWKVEVTENGNPLTVTRIQEYDPFHLIAYLKQRYMRGLEAGHPTPKNFRTFKVTASSANSTLMIKVTDRFGNVYTETMTRPKNFDVRLYESN